MNRPSRADPLLEKIQSFRFRRLEAIRAIYAIRTRYGRRKCLRLLQKIEHLSVLRSAPIRIRGNTDVGFIDGEPSLFVTIDGEPFQKRIAWWPEPRDGIDHFEGRNEGSRGTKVLSPSKIMEKDQ